MAAMYQKTPYNVRSLLSRENFVSIELLASDGLTRLTCLPEQGGLLTQLQMPDASGQSREILYLPGDWQAQGKICGGWPLCFPICGRLSCDGASQYRHNGRLYRLDIHGFAHAQPWQVVEQTAQRLTIQLQDTPETRACYPFEFCLTLTYEIAAGVLSCRQRCENRGQGPLHYYAGLHPYFYIDPTYQKSAVQIDVPGLRRIVYNDDLTDVVGEAAAPEFPLPLSAPDVNESLHEIDVEQPIRLLFPADFCLEMMISGPAQRLLRYVQLYHVPEQPFFCIEPWMAPPNSLNHPERLPVLAPGEVHDMTVIMSAKSCQGIA